MTFEDHPALLRRFRDFGAVTWVTLLTYLLKSQSQKLSNQVYVISRVEGIWIQLNIQADWA